MRLSLASACRAGAWIILGVTLAACGCGKKEEGSPEFDQFTPGPKQAGLLVEGMT
jgi:hypothetical protein